VSNGYRLVRKGEIEKYMSIHQHDPNANEIWTYFRNVIERVQLTFINHRKEMKSIAWGGLYDKYHGDMFDTTKIEQEIQSVMMDDDITNKKGAYPYVLTRNKAPCLFGKPKEGDI